MDVKNIRRVPSFTTKDGSEIRELLAHRNSALRNQTLAEARLPPGASTAPHHHARTGVLKFLCCCAPGYEHHDTFLAAS